MCVVEKAEGGVRSHPAVINLLATRNAETEVNVCRGGRRDETEASLMERKVQRKKDGKGIRVRGRELQ